MKFFVFIKIILIILLVKKIYKEKLFQNQLFYILKVNKVKSKNLL